MVHAFMRRILSEQVILLGLRNTYHNLQSTLLFWLFCYEIVSDKSDVFLSLVCLTIIFYVGY